MSSDEISLRHQLAAFLWPAQQTQAPARQAFPAAAQRAVAAPRLPVAVPADGCLAGPSPPPCFLPDDSRRDLLAHLILVIRNRKLPCGSVCFHGAWSSLICSWTCGGGA